MRYLFLSLLLPFLTSAQAFAQTNSLCAEAIRICPENPIAYEVTTDFGQAEDGPSYNCLGSTPNPSWYYFQIENLGTHELELTNSLDEDLDFMLWGPFWEENNWCDSLTDEKAADCSYAAGNNEFIQFTSTLPSAYYVLVITNYSNQALVATLDRLSGTGTFDCTSNAPCQISLFTAEPSFCNEQTNQFEINGTLWTFNAPQNNNLIIGVGENTISIAPPFVNPIEFNVQGLPADGQPFTLNAFFAADTDCSAELNLTAPEGCISCNLQISGATEVCEGATLSLSTNMPPNSQFSWSGPDNFSSGASSLQIENFDASNVGTYTLLVVGENCAESAEITITTLPSPLAAISQPDTTICEGDDLTLSAMVEEGLTANWIGPNGFLSTGNSFTLNDIGMLQSGTYFMEVSSAICSTIDLVEVEVSPTPVFTLQTDPVVNPQQGSSLLIAQGEEGLTYSWSFSGLGSLIENVLYSSDRDSAVVFWANLSGTVLVVVTATNELGCSSETLVRAIELDLSASIGEMPEQLPAVFPNPASAFVAFRGFNTSAQLRIYDAAGRLVLDQNVVANQQVSTAHLPSGLYIYQLEGSTVSRGKLILSKGPQ
jgi:hypothetical protein